MATDSGTTTVDVPPPPPPPPPPVESENQKSADLQSSRVPPDSTSEPQGLEPLGLEPTPEFQQGLDDFKESKAERQADAGTQESADLQSSRVPPPDAQAPDTQPSASDSPADQDSTRGPDAPDTPVDGPPSDNPASREARPDTDDATDRPDEQSPVQPDEQSPVQPDEQPPVQPDEQPPAQPEEVPADRMEVDQPGDTGEPPQENEGDWDLDKNSRTLPDEYYDNAPDEDAADNSLGDDLPADPRSGDESGQPDPEQLAGEKLERDPEAVDPAEEGDDGDWDLDKNSRTLPDEFYDNVSTVDGTETDSTETDSTETDSTETDGTETPDEPTDWPELTPSELEGKTKQEIRDLAKERGLKPFGNMDTDGESKKWKYPDTNKEALLVHSGHVDEDGEPYNLEPNAARPHAHGFDKNHKPVVDPVTADKHFPLKE